jgi:hypothetical protein
MRITPRMNDLLMDSAKRNNRSFSAEIESRLDHSFRSQEALSEALAVTFGADGAELLKLLGRLIRHAPGARGMGVEDPWRNDPTAYSIAAREIRHALKRLRPSDDPSPVPAAEVEGRVDRLLVALKMIDPPSEWADGLWTDEHGHQRGEFGGIDFNNYEREEDVR